MSGWEAFGRALACMMAAFTIWSAFWESESDHGWAAVGRFAVVVAACAVIIWAATSWAWP